MADRFISGKSRGQIALFMSAVILVLIASFALCTDIGVVYLSWEQAQKAADAAALAGASYLPLSPSVATSTASTYAQSNGMTAGEITSNQVSADTLSITVSITRKPRAYFGVLLGFKNYQVSASATATAETVGSATGVLPFGIAYQTPYTAGQVVNLQQGQVGPGNWSALSIGGTGASNYLSNIESGSSVAVNVGSYLSTETGIMNGPTKTGINYLLNEGMNVDSGGTYSSHTINDPRAVIVPMVDFSSVNGQSQVPVKGFAELWLVSVDGNAQITTYFISQVAAGAIPSSSATNFGAYTAALTQ